MKLEHELLIKREKLAHNQCTCETGCGFPTMSEYKWYITVVQQCVTQEGDPILASMKESNKYRVLLCKI